MQNGWQSVAEDYMKSQGLRLINEEEYSSFVPEDIRNTILGIVDDDDAPLGQRPPDMRTVKRYFNELAPYFDYQVMTVLDIEVRALAFLADFIKRHELTDIVDAGCGTGITTAFLAKQFPSVKFYAYDVAGKMTAQARSRCRKLKLSNAEFATMQHQGLSESLLDSFDLVFSKCSFGSELVTIPDFSLAPSEQLAKEDFYGSDPTMWRWLESLESFARLLRHEGIFLDIGLACPPREAVVDHLASEAGFERDDSLSGLITTSCPGNEETVVAVGYRKR